MHVTALSSLCTSATPLPSATSAIESCLYASCTQASQTWNPTYASALCSIHRSCSDTTTGSNPQCTGWYLDGNGRAGHGDSEGLNRGDNDDDVIPKYGPGYNGDWPGHHGSDHAGESTAGGPWRGWGAGKGNDGYYHVSPSGTCTEGLVTKTETMTSVVTDEGVVVTTYVEEVRTGTVVGLAVEETGSVVVIGTEGFTQTVDAGTTGSVTAMVGVSTTAVTGAGDRVVAAVGGLMGIAVGAVAIL